MAAEPAIKYRLIKKEKHTGARLGEIIMDLIEYLGIKSIISSKDKVILSLNSPFVI